MNVRTVAVSIGIAALFALLVWGLVQSGDAGIKDGSPVPTSSLPRLPDDGTTGSLADYRGQWVLLNVWASWCKPCRAESPALEEFAARHADTVQVLGVATRDISDDALRFMEKYDLSYPQLRDADGDYAKGELKTSGVPESFLVDPDGNLAGHFPGPFKDLASVEAFAAPALGTKGA